MSGLIKLQKSLYRYMKSKALALESDQSVDLKAYQRAQARLSRRDFRVVEPEDLMRRLESTPLTFVGDFHSFDQSSRNMERLLRTLDKKNGRLAIGVEFVTYEDQSKIDALLEGHITELEFLDAIDYQNSWRFPWPHYKKFFQFAKDKNLKVLALNSEGTLDKRDQFASKLIASFFQENPDSSLIVFFGELHIVADKLPKKVKQRCPNLKTTIIHQNLDEVFWKLLEKNKNDLNPNKSKDIIIKFNEEEYSLQTSPPWTKYESIIYWYEHLVEDPDFEIHEYMMETGLAFNSTVPDTFVYITSKLASTLNKSIDLEDIEDFNLYDHQKMDMVEKKLSSLNDVQHNFYKKIMMRGRSFRLPYRNDYYCSSYSVNRITFLAGLHLQNILMSKKVSGFDDLFKKGQWERFCLFIKQMCMAYFCSKVLNPYRKCDHYENVLERIKSLENQARHSQMKDESDLAVLKTAKSLLEARTSDDFIGEVKGSIKNLDAIVLYYAARLCGYALGDLLYENHYVKEVASFQDIFETLISDSKNLEEDMQKLFFSVIPKSGPYGMRKRLF